MADNGSLLMVFHCRKTVIDNYRMDSLESDVRTLSV